MLESEIKCGTIVRMLLGSHNKMADGSLSYLRYTVLSKLLNYGSGPAHATHTSNTFKLAELGTGSLYHVYATPGGDVPHLERDFYGQLCLELTQENTKDFADIVSAWHGHTYLLNTVAIVNCDSPSLHLSRKTFLNIIIDAGKIGILNDFTEYLKPGRFKLSGLNDPSKIVDYIADNEYLHNYLPMYIPEPDGSPRMGQSNHIEFPQYLLRPITIDDSLPKGIVKLC